MDIKKYLREFPLVSSSEGFFDTITGRSKPKDNMDAKNIKKVIQDTYLNDEWLAKFKSVEDKVKVKRGEYLTYPPEAGWRVYLKEMRTEGEMVMKLVQRMGAIADSYVRFLEGPNATDLSSATQEHTRIIREFDKFESDVLAIQPEQATYSELPALTKGQIKKIGLYLLKPLNPKPAIIPIDVMVEDIVSSWYGVGSKYQKLAREVYKRSGERRDVWGGTANVISEKVDGLGWKLEHWEGHRTYNYKNALIRWCNASLK